MSTQRYESRLRRIHADAAREAVRAQADYDASRLAGVNPPASFPGTSSRHTAGGVPPCRRGKPGMARARARSRSRAVAAPEANVLALLGTPRCRALSAPRRCRASSSRDRARLHPRQLRPCCAPTVDGRCNQTRLDGSHRLHRRSSGSSERASRPCRSCCQQRRASSSPSPILRARTAAGARMHSDAIQGWLHIPFDVSALASMRSRLPGQARWAARLGIGAPN